MTDMQPTQGAFTGLLKKILFRPAVKHPRFQQVWGRLHTLAVYAMNYGGGGLVETSGEAWALANIVRRECEHTPAPVVFDVGANIGDYALLVRRHLPRAVVYAFEPAKAVYEELSEHVRAEGESVRPFNLGFSDTEKTVELYSYTVEGQAVSLISSIDLRLPTQAVEVKTQASERVRVETLDRFCEREGVELIDFLKLDVEGHELSVLKGARRLLSEGRVSVIQFEFGPANIYSRTFFYDFWSLLGDDYRIYRIVPEGIAPITFYGEHHEIFLTTNYLAVRKRKP